MVSVIRATDTEPAVCDAMETTHRSSTLQQADVLLAAGMMMLRANEPFSLARLYCQFKYMSGISLLFYPLLFLHRPRPGSTFPLVRLCICLTRCQAFPAFFFNRFSSFFHYDDAMQLRRLLYCLTTFLIALYCTNFDLQHGPHTSVNGIRAVFTCTTREYPASSLFFLERRPSRCIFQMKSDVWMLRTSRQNTRRARMR